MAHRYGMLPSEILARGTTQDVFMFDIYTTYQNHVNEKQRQQMSKHSGLKPPPAVTASNNEELLERYNKFREKNSK